MKSNGEQDLLLRLPQHFIAATAINAEVGKWQAVRGEGHLIRKQ